MNGFYMLVAVAGLISALITFFLGRFFKDRVIVKYVPAILFALVTLALFIKSRFFSTGFEDLAYIILALIAGIVFYISFLTALIIGMVQRKNRKNH